MVEFIVVVREVGKLKPDYSLSFSAPELPKVGHYISIHRPDRPEPFGEDLVVRKVWWRLHHPETGGFGSEPPKIGGLQEIFVECDPALGPYANDHWREMMEAAKARGIEVEDFELDRFSVREADVKS